MPAMTTCDDCIRLAAAYGRAEQAYITAMGLIVESHDTYRRWSTTGSEIRRRGFGGAGSRSPNFGGSRSRYHRRAQAVMATC